MDNSSRASRALLPRPEHGCACFDPAFDASDCALLRRFGISVIDRNEECRRSVRAHQDPSSPAPRTLFFMVHCSRQMYSNVLSANWRASDLGRVAIVGNSFERYGLFEQDGAPLSDCVQRVSRRVREVVVAGTASRRKQNVSRHDAPYSLVDPGMIYSAFNDTSFISVPDSAVSTLEAEDQFAQDNVPKPADATVEDEIITTGTIPDSAGGEQDTQRDPDRDFITTGTTPTALVESRIHRETRIVGSLAVVRLELPLPTIGNCAQR